MGDNRCVFSALFIATVGTPIRCCPAEAHVPVHAGFFFFLRCFERAGQYWLNTLYGIYLFSINHGMFSEILIYLLFDVCFFTPDIN